MTKKNILKKLKIAFLPLLGLTTSIAPIAITIQNQSSWNCHSVNAIQPVGLNMTSPLSFDEYLANKDTKPYFIPQYAEDTVLSADGFALPYYKNANDEYVFQSIFQLFPNANIAKIIADTIGDNPGSSLYQLDDTGNPISRLQISNHTFQFNSWLVDGKDDIKNSSNQILTFLFGNPYLNGISQQNANLEYNEPWIKLEANATLNINLSNNNLWILPANCFSVFNQAVTATININLNSNRLTYYPNTILTARTNNVDPEVNLQVSDNNILVKTQSAVDYNIDFGTGNDVPIINLHDNSIYALVTNNGKTNNIWPSAFDLTNNDNKTVFIESMLNTLKLTSYPVTTSLQPSVDDYFLLTVDNFSDMSGNVKLSIEQYNGSNKVANGVSASQSFTLNALVIGLIIDALTLTVSLIVLAAIIYQIVKRSRKLKKSKK